MGPKIKGLMEHKPLKNLTVTQQMRVLLADKSTEDKEALQFKS